MNKKLFVGGLSFSLTEEDLLKVFLDNNLEVAKETDESGEERYAVRIIKDKFTGNSRGFAFVTMASDEAAKAAIDALNGQDIDGSGRKITVNEAKERTDDDRRGGGGYGGGNRSGGGGNRGGGYGGGGNNNNRRRY